MIKNAAYYAELSAALHLAYGETKPSQADVHNNQIENLRYQLFSGGNKARDLSQILAEEERTAAAELAAAKPKL